MGYINSTPVQIVIDTGAACNVVSLSYAPSFIKSHCNETLNTAGNHRISVLGYATFEITINNNKFNITPKS